MTNQQLSMLIGNAFLQGMLLSQPQPTLSQPQPTLPQPQPTLPQPQPTLSQPQPTLPQPQPTLSQPQPTLTQPQPTLDLQQMFQSFLQQNSTIDIPPQLNLEQRLADHFSGLYTGGTEQQKGANV